MNVIDFNNLVKMRKVKISNTLTCKGKEYANEKDRLAHFKRAARLTNKTPAEALWGIAIKHLLSVIDMVEGRTEPNSLMIDEKIGDMINYLILLEAILKEEIPVMEYKEVKSK